MNSQQVLITSSYLAPGDAVYDQLTSAGCDVVYSRPQDRHGVSNHLRDALKNADAVIAGTEPFGSDEFAEALHLKIIARTGVGYDNIDLDAATQHGVTVCTTPGANANAVAELTLGLMLDCARSISQSRQRVVTGEWEQVSGTELSGTKLGVIGLGAIGRRVTVLARAIGMSVCAYDKLFDSAFLSEHHVEPVSMDELMRTSDFITLHVGLTPETVNLIGAPELGRMKSNAVVINTSRGGIVDEVALANAIREGVVGGAGLDVLAREPAEAGNDLMGLEKCIITPHIAGATRQARGESGRMAADQVIKHFNGESVPFPATLENE
jgi:D-3-phosphoglycerate dehydrogenase/(S)-sulfolactate dehydrogenase